MKRIISLALALLLAAGMAGCGHAPNDQPPAETPQASAETADKEKLSEAASAETAATDGLSPETEASSVQNSSGEGKPFPRISTGRNYDPRYDEALGVSLVSAYSPMIYCGSFNSERSGVNDDPNYPGLAKALRSLSNELAETCRKNADEYEKFARMDVQSMGPESVAGRYFARTDACIVRADSIVTSIKAVAASYSGGAHPYAGYSGYNFDSGSGSRLLLSDVLTEEGMQRFSAVFESELYKQYPYFKDALLVEDLQSAISDEIRDGSLNFNIGNEALTVLISPYEIAAYAVGPAFVRLSFSDYPGLVREKYSASSGSYVSAVMTQSEDIYGIEINETFTGSDGQLRSLSLLFTPYPYDGSSPPSLSVKLDGAEWSPNDFYASEVAPYIFRTDGKVYLYIEYSSENDWRGIYILDLNGDRPVLMQNLAEAFYGDNPTDPHNFTLSTRTDIMSTYSISRSYSASSGVPVPLEYLYSVSLSPTLTLRQDTVMTVLASADSDAGTSATIPAGTKFTVYRTDNVSLVDLLAADGRICRVRFDRSDDYLGTVNGKPLTEAFAGTAFAG